MIHITWYATIMEHLGSVLHRKKVSRRNSRLFKFQLNTLHIQWREILCLHNIIEEMIRKVDCKYNFVLKRVFYYNGQQKVFPTFQTARCTPSYGSIVIVKM